MSGVVVWAKVTAVQCAVRAVCAVAQPQHKDEELGLWAHSAQLGAWMGHSTSSLHSLAGECAGPRSVCGSRIW
eukprot:1842827-Prymnesium_polylepis.1